MPTPSASTTVAETSLLNLRDLEHIAKNTGIVCLRVLPARFDIPQLLTAYENHCLSAEKTIQSNDTYGGWSLLSKTGALDECFWSGGRHYDKTTGEYTIRKMDREPFRAPEMRIPTALYEPFKHYFEVMTEMGLTKIYRTRITEIGEGGDGVGWHCDRPLDPFGYWRLHVPIKTHLGAFYQWKWSKHAPEHSVHIPADGCLYIIRADIPHRIRNRKTQGDPQPLARAHIMTDTRMWHLIASGLTVEPFLDLGPAEDVPAVLGTQEDHPEKKPAEPPPQ
jgi:hypothetical protein